jgi:lysozyme
MVPYKVYIKRQIQEEGVKDFLKRAAFAGGLALGAHAATPQQQTKTPIVNVASNINKNEIFNMLKKHEGYKPQMYKDTEGNWTIGVGHLITPNEVAKFKNKKLSDAEIRSLFDSDLNIAIANSKKFVPNFNTLPLPVQHAIVNMTFNLSINRLMKFKDLRQSLASKDFNQASKDMLNSKWASQVKGRAVELSNMVKSVAKKPVTVSSGE